MPKRKKKATAAQLRALAKGRATAKRNRRAKAAGKKTKKRATTSTAYRKMTKKTRKPRARKGTSMPKKKAKRTSRRKSSGRRRGGGRGFLSGIEWKDMAGAAAYGYLENQVKEKGEEALLKKVPLFFEGIGYAGCLGVLAHFAGKSIGGSAGVALRHLSKGTLDVAAYKLMRNGELFKDKAAADAALAGDGDEVGYGADGIEVGFTDDPSEVSGDDEVGYGADGSQGY